MLRKLENISSFLSFRDASIRTKVILAFLGVLLLILPQIVLTVTYMVDLFEDGENVGRSSSASLILGKIHTDLEDSFLGPYRQPTKSWRVMIVHFKRWWIRLKAQRSIFGSYKRKTRDSKRMSRRWRKRAKHLTLISIP